MGLKPRPDIIGANLDEAMSETLRDPASEFSLTLVDQVPQYSDTITAEHILDPTSATQAATDDLVASLIPDVGTATGAALDAAIATPSYLGDGTTQHLAFSYVIGFAGERLHLTGADGVSRPYFEVAPELSPLPEDDAGSVAGMQVYGTPGGGGVNDRHFLAIEARFGASADEWYAPYFAIQGWSSGVNSGDKRPIAIGTGTHRHLLFTDAAGIRVLNDSRFYWDAVLETPASIPIEINRNDTVVMQERTYSDIPGQTSILRLLRDAGTAAVPGTPSTGYLLGKVVFGHTVSTTPTERASIGAVAAGDWSGVARGAQLDFYSTASGSSTLTKVATMLRSITDTETSLSIDVRNAGASSIRLVTIGAADSGGVGFRVLRVPN